MALLIPDDLTASIVLIRHGESTWITEGRFQGRGNPPLSELGERQAALVAGRLADRDAGTPLPIPAGPPLGVWHSPLARAAQTATAIAAAQTGETPLTPLPTLTEIAQGEWEGLPRSEVNARWPAELTAWRRSPATSHAPGGESLRDASARVRTGLTDVLDAMRSQALSNQPSRTSLTPLPESPVPGYSNPGAADGPPEPWALLVAHDGIFRLALMNLLDVPLERFWAFPFSLCAISVFALREGVASLRAHNLSEHLAALADEARAQAEARGDRRGAL